MTEIIINDETPSSVTHDPLVGRGLDLSERPDADFGYGAAADPFPPELLIPRSEWQARIAEMEATQSRISDWIRAVGLPPQNQGQTNFCWANAPTHCVEIIRSQQNQRMVILSPASVACQVNGYRNQGGWGKDALEWIIAHGVVPVDKWPANAIDRRYATPNALVIAQQYRIDEWTELAPRNIDQLVSMLLHRMPVAIGLNWWGHEVTACDPIWLDGTVAVRIRNSWGNWGDNGFGILQGSKMLPDDAVCPRTALVGE